jgi:hypothetical protein
LVWRYSGRELRGLRAKLSARRKWLEYQPGSICRRIWLHPLRCLLEILRKRVERGRSQNAVFEASENREDCLTALGIVEQRDWSCVVKIADGRAQPAHCGRPITQNLSGTPHDFSLRTLIRSCAGRGVPLPGRVALCGLLPFRCRCHRLPSIHTVPIPKIIVLAVSIDLVPAANAQSCCRTNGFCAFVHVRLTPETSPQSKPKSS